MAETVPWVARLTEILEPHRGDAPRYGAGSWRPAFERTPLFTPLEHAEFHLEHELSPDGVVARAASVSFIAALPDAQREAVAGAGPRAARGGSGDTRPRERPAAVPHGRVLVRELDSPRRA
ncbi:MAG: hypothetical protein ACRDNE_11875 [Gaiellaceae bacterium]